jgi:hypothetical protein
MRATRSRARPLLLLLAVLAVAASALALATGPDITPPPGLLYRPHFIDREGNVLVPSLEPPPGVDTRTVFIDRDGTVRETLLVPPAGIDQRPLFIDRDGHLTQTELDPPPGLVSAGPFIKRDGTIDRTLADLLPVPPGLDQRPPFIGRDGELLQTGSAAPPAEGKLLKLQLQGVYPNPFNPAVEVSFRLRAPARVQVAVLDPRGRLIRVLQDGALTADLHVLRWDGRDAAGRPVAAGSYLFRVRADGEEVVGRGVLVK